MRATLVRALAAGLALAAGVHAQEAPGPHAPAPPESWVFSGSVFASDPPGAGERWTPILYGDRGALHLELRYGYEDEETFALFAGGRAELGEELTLELIPMLGLVAGQTDGLAPALELDACWKRLEWYAESEYLLDFHERDDDFFYAWSTLTCELAGGLSAGLVTERTKLVDTDLSVQRGLALEFARGSLNLALYGYNLGTDDSYAVIALGFAP